MINMDAQNRAGTLAMQKEHNIVRDLCCGGPYNSNWARRENIFNFETLKYQPDPAVRASVRIGSASSKFHFSEILIYEIVDLCFSQNAYLPRPGNV